jgi:hypothetical protein
MQAHFGPWIGSFVVRAPFYSAPRCFLVLSSGAAPKIGDDTCYSGGSTLGGALHETKSGCDLLVSGGRWQLPRIVAFFAASILCHLGTLKASLFWISRWIYSNEYILGRVANMLDMCKVLFWPRHCLECVLVVSSRYLKTPEDASFE